SECRHDHSFASRENGWAMSAAVQTLWAELVAASLADAGVRTCVISPGSRSTPLVAALAADGRFDLPTIIDERAAAFFALGHSRAVRIPDRSTFRCRCANLSSPPRRATPPSAH